MKNKIKYIFILAYFLIEILFKCYCFMPLRLEDRILKSLNINNRLDKVSDSLTHEDIIKRGLLKSVAKYLGDKKKRVNSEQSLDLLLIKNGSMSVEDIYFKFYGRHFCLLGLNPIIEESFEKNVAKIDVDSQTKDLAYAHFDSETLIGSNRRVMNFTNMIFESLKIKDYKKARELTGQILHTIHDFYSHTNWIEMGNQNRINKLIGTLEFETKQSIIKTDDIDTCTENCVEVVVECDEFYNVIKDVFANKLNAPITNCPFSYYKCKNNVIVLDKLLSGYFQGSKLDDETLIFKQENNNKCSHGGVLDLSSNKPAKGGINKDAGYYMISPRADLHLIAANLAIDHTEFYFDQIRSNIGDREFAKFLRLDPEVETFNKICDLFKFTRRKELI